MATIIEKTGKTVEDALSAALAELGVTAEDVEVVVLETPSKGFFGFGAKPAKIQVTVKEPATATEILVEPAETAAEIIEVVEPATVEAVETVVVETVEAAGVEAGEAGGDTGEAEFDRDAVIAFAQDFLGRVFAAMEIDVEITARAGESEVVLDIAGENLGVLIGKHGQTLDALQYVTNLAANRAGAAGKIYFVLDVENYRKRRADSLKKLAKSVAERAIRTRQDVKLEPMSRSERRIVHTALQGNDRIETHSAGEDPYRYIIVSPKRRGR